jgi:hypothetical protein
MRFAMVVGMSQNVDPSGNTEAFRAFQEREEQAAAPAAASRTPLFVGLVIAAVVVVALVVWLVV